MIINEFIENKIIRHGEYTLKSNEKSNIYIDLKKIVSYLVIYQQKFIQNLIGLSFSMYQTKVGMAFFNQRKK